MPSRYGSFLPCPCADSAQPLFLHPLRRPAIAFHTGIHPTEISVQDLKLQMSPFERSARQESQRPSREGLARCLATRPRKQTWSRSTISKDCTNEREVRRQRLMALNRMYGAKDTTKIGLVSITDTCSILPLGMQQTQSTHTLNSSAPRQSPYGDKACLVPNCRKKTCYAGFGSTRIYSRYYFRRQFWPANFISNC